MKKTIYDLELHELIFIGNQTECLRVPGGCIYRSWDKDDVIVSACFVPIDKSEKSDDVSGLLQWCYNYVNKQKDSDEKEKIIEELKKMGCV